MEQNVTKHIMLQRKMEQQPIVVQADIQNQVVDLVLNVIKLPNQHQIHLMEVGM